MLKGRKWSRHHFKIFQSHENNPLWASRFSFKFFSSWIFMTNLKFLLTVLFPKFLTLHTRWTVFPTRPVTFDETVVSKYGPVPGVGKSVRNSCRNFLVFPANAPRIFLKRKRNYFLLNLRKSCHSSLSP